MAGGRYVGARCTIHRLNRPRIIQKMTWARGRARRQRGSRGRQFLCLFEVLKCRNWFVASGGRAPSTARGRSGECSTLFHLVPPWVRRVVGLHYHWQRPHLVSNEKLEDFHPGHHGAPSCPWHGSRAGQDLLVQLRQAGARPEPWKVEKHCPK